MKKWKELKEEVLQNFNYEEVIKVMGFLNWTWSASLEGEDYIPNKERIQLSLSERCDNAIEGIKELEIGNTYYASSGGLKVTASTWYEDGKVVKHLECEFVVTSWEAQSDT